MKPLLYRPTVKTADTGTAKKAKFITALVGFALVLSLTFTSAQAYDDDTHFWLTYLLARKVGYDRFQALDIASADLSVDYDKQTWPILPLSLHMQDQRKRLHALPSTREAVKCRDKARKQIEKNKHSSLTDEEIERLEESVHQCLQPQIEAELNGRWQDAVNTGNPGVFLHYYQDSFAHRGFQSRLGHLRAGHIPDFLSSDPVKAYDMALGTIRQLRRFMEMRWPDKPLSAEPDWEKDIKPIVTRFIEVNDSKIKMDAIYSPWDWDSTRVKTRIVYGDEPDSQPEKKTADLLRLLFKLRDLPSPNSYKAYEIVNELYPNEVGQIWIYNLNKKGLPKKEGVAAVYWYGNDKTKKPSRLRKAEAHAWSLSK
jgi:hypothetical protein